MNIQIEKLNIADIIVIVALSAALLISIFYEQNELSMSVASGLLGYIGGAAKSSTLKHKEEEEIR